MNAKKTNGEAAPQKIEEKLYQNRYVVDSGRPHVRIKEHSRTVSRN